MKTKELDPKLLENEHTDEHVGCYAISFSQQNKILKQLTNHKYHNFFWFCCCTGVRAGEALNISTSDINKSKTKIKITLPDSKTKKHERIIPCLPSLFNGFDLSQEKLFEDISDEGSKQYFFRLYNKLNMPLSRHSTRHTFISILNHLKVPVETVKTWAGHTDVHMTTDVYTHKLRKGKSDILNYLTKLKAKYIK